MNKIIAIIKSMILCALSLMLCFSNVFSICAEDIPQETDTPVVEEEAQNQADTADKINEPVQPLEETEQTITSVDLSNCSKLRSFSIYEFNKLNSVNKTEITINISGSPNIESVVLSESINELDISDCPLLISATEQTPSDKDYCLEYESEDGYIWASNEKLKIIK